MSSRNGLPVVRGPGVPHGHEEDGGAMPRSKYAALSCEARLRWLCDKGLRHNRRWLEYGADVAEVELADLKAVLDELDELRTILRLKENL